MKALRTSRAFSRPVLLPPRRLGRSTTRCGRLKATPSREIAFFGWPWTRKGKDKQVDVDREEALVAPQEPSAPMLSTEHVQGEEVVEERNGDLDLGSASATRSQARVEEAGASQEADVPWFVDRDYLDPVPAASPARRAPVQPPPILPSLLHPLHAHLVDSPFFDADSIAYIDAKNEPDGMGEEAWAEWVVVAELRAGRERGIAGATDGVRQMLKALALDQRLPRVEGVENPRSEWAMVDAGSVIVHIVTADAREAFDIEGVWTGRRRRHQQPQPHPQPLRMSR